MSSQSSHPSLPQGATGTPMQRQLNANLQAQQSQLGQNASPPQSSLSTGQDEGPPPQTSGMFPTSAAQGPQPLSALHSNKPKRPVMPTNTGYPGQAGSPSPRSTPPPPMGVSGSAPAARSSPPPSSNLPVSSMPPVSYNSPVTGLATTSQDSPTGTRPISSRRRMYPAQTSPPSMPGVPAGMTNVPNQSNQFPGQMPTMAPQQLPTGPSPSQFPSPGGGLEGPMGRLTVQQPSGCRSINLMEQRHILPTTPVEQPTPNLAPDLRKRISLFGTKF